MSLSIPDPIPIEPLTQERPRGSPCGAQAYTTRLTAESFEAIKTALLVQEQARTIERDLSAKKGIPWATSKNEKHVVQLVVDANGKPSMVVGDKTFPVQALQESKGHEIVARQTTSTHCDSDTGEMIPEHSSLHTIAQVVGRFQVSRFLDDNNAAQVREYTKKHEKERNSTIVLGNDEYMAQQHKRSLVKVEATQPPSSTATSQAGPISSSTVRSTKQPQAPTSSAAPYLPVPDAEVPPEFKSLSLTIPRTWERENISLPLRTIHVMVLNKHTEAEISTEIEKYTGQKPPPGELHEILTRIAIRDSSTGQWALREPAYLYVRPFDYPDYDRSDRPAAVKATRPKLRALGYPDEGPRFEVLRRSTVLATPMVTSLSMAPSENPGGVTTAYRTVDLEAVKRAAESNPAPVLKSNVKPGFFSSSTDIKKKKTSKTKEPKEPKEPREPKESKPKKTKTKRDDRDMKPRAPRENEPSPAPAAPPSKATLKLEPEPYIDSKAPIVRAQSRPGPGSAAGKLAAKKRLAEEAVMREKGILAESIQLPVLKPTPSSKSAPSTARSSPASVPLKPSLKRKSASDSSESPPKRRRVEMEEGEIDEATLPAARKGKAKAAQPDDDDDDYDNFVAQSMKKRRSVSDDEKPPTGLASVKKADDAGLRASSKTKKQVVDDEYEDAKPARKKPVAASTPTTAKRRPVKEEEDEYGSKTASQRSVRWNTEVEEKSAAGIKKRKLAVTQEDDDDYDDQRPKKKKKSVKAEVVESLTSSRPKQRASKADDEYDIKGRLERAKGTMPGAKRKADADLVAAIASPPLKLLKPDEALSQRATKQSLRVAKAESPRVQPLKQTSTPAQPSGLRNLVASSVVEETKKMRKMKPDNAKPYAASPNGQLVRHPGTKVTNGKASASPAPVVTVDGKKSIPPPPPEPAADYTTTVMNVINRQVPNTLEDLQSKFEGLIQVDNALRTFLEFDQLELKEKRSASGVLKPGAASLFQKIKRTHELRHKLTMETQKVAHALQQLGGINDANPVTTRLPVPRPDSPDDVVSTRQRNLPVPEGITEEMEARHAESKQRWVEAQALCYSSQPTTPHRTPLALPSSVPVRSPTLAPPPPASVPGLSNCNPSSITNSSPPIHAPRRVSITLQESPTQSTPPAGTQPENKQSFQEVKTESKAFRRFRKVAPSASATPGAPGTPTVAGLQSQQAMAYNNPSPSGSGLPASAATPVTAATPTPIANAATPAATAPTPGVAPSPVIPTVAVFSPVA